MRHGRVAGRGSSVPSFHFPKVTLLLSSVLHLCTYGVLIPVGSARSRAGESFGSRESRACRKLTHKTQRGGGVSKKLNV
jgi:hypothetical protein